jgi:glycosyltransferase involved in cell wall biosynthesis
LPDREAIVIGGIGRLDPVKGYDSLIQVVARLVAEFPNVILALAGSGPDRERLNRIARESGIESRVRFLGFHADVRPVYQAFDVFAMPSLSEALPYAVLEAMASGLPVVGTIVGGVPEIIVPGETGLLVPPRDPNALAESLRILLRDAGLRARMGTAGRERVMRHFHERDMVRRTMDLYRSMVEGQREPLMSERCS